MSPANWVRQEEDEGGELELPVESGQGKRQLAVLGSSHPFLEQRCTVFPVDHWVPQGVDGRTWPWEDPI